MNPILNRYIPKRTLATYRLSHPDGARHYEVQNVYEMSVGGLKQFHVYSNCRNLFILLKQVKTPLTRLNGHSWAITFLAVAI